GAGGAAERGVPPQVRAAGLRAGTGVVERPGRRWAVRVRAAHRADLELVPDRRDPLHLRRRRRRLRQARTPRRRRGGRTVRTTRTFDPSERAAPDRSLLQG